MDLLGCPGCGERFVLRDAGTGEGWICTDCRNELRVIAHKVPRGIFPANLDPHHLQRVDRSLIDRFFRRG